MAKCPLNNFKDCIEGKCTFWVKMTGMNPQTGMPVDQWGCKHVWDTILTSEQNLVIRQNTAAIESFRNRMVEAGDKYILATKGIVAGLIANVKVNDEDTEKLLGCGSIAHEAGK